MNRKRTKATIEERDDMNELISIIIPVYNNAEHLEACLRSVLIQTYSNFEILVIDDGSKDDSWKVCRRLQREDKRIFAFHKEHQGVSEARNLGMEKASGDYFVFLDGDDMLHPLFLETTLKRARETGVDVVCCDFFKCESKDVKVDISENFSESFNGQWISLSQDGLRSIFFKRKIEALESACCKLISRDLIINRGDLQKFESGIVLGEDTLFMYNLIRKGFRMEYTDRKGYLYRMHQESTTHNWEIYKAANPLAIYKIIRDKEAKDGNTYYAKEMEKAYLSILRGKYNLAKKERQKEVCQNLRQESEEAMRSREFTGSKLIYFLTFHSYLLYRMGIICWHVLKRVGGDGWNVSLFNKPFGKDGEKRVNKDFRPDIC